MYRVVYHKAVAIDIAEALTYYNDISPRLSIRFEEELFNKIQDIQQHPLHYGFFEYEKEKVLQKDHA